MVYGKRKNLTPLLCVPHMAQVEDVTGDGGVVTKVIKKGQDYKRPNEGSLVKLAYTARVGDANGPIFEERSRDDPLEYTADEGKEIQRNAFLELAMQCERFSAEPKGDSLVGNIRCKGQYSRM